MKKSYNKIYILSLLTVFLLNACFIVILDFDTDVAPAITLSPKPQIEMSETIVRSEDGDMIAFLPKNWFFVDLEDKIASDVFAVALNPSYTLSAVFSKVKKNSEIQNLIEKEKLIGLARSCLAKRQSKTGDAVKLQGKYTLINMGTLSFCKYSYSTTNGVVSGQSAVFISTLAQYYEFSLIPMSINGKSIPPKLEIEKIFNSILSTIQY